MFISIESFFTIGALASKKNKDCWPIRFAKYEESLSLVNGPVATIVGSFPSVSTSSSWTTKFGKSFKIAVILPANASRSTLNALPLGTQVSEATFIVNESICLISSFNKPHALSRRFDFKEFEQTSSPK